MSNFDYVVIGAGQGNALARLLAEAGKKVALIEKRFIGGTCTNVGCTPTKAHIAAAKVAHVVKSSQRFGISSRLDSVDLKSVVARTRRIVEDFRRESEQRLQGTEGLELIYGEARFCSEDEVEIQLREGTTRKIKANIYVLAVGAKVEIPVIEGLSKIPYLTHVEALNLEIVPSQLLILGGGYIACEFAQMFTRFGSRVTIIQNQSHVLPREDADISDVVVDILEREGIEVILGEQVNLFRRVGNQIEAAWADKRRQFSHVLVATGQSPRTDALNLKAVNVEVNESGYIVTDAYLRTSNPRVYALGDCKGGSAFTHIAYDDARILRDGFLYDRWRDKDDRLVPYTVFIDPQLGRIGLSEKDAVEQGKQFDVVRLNMKETARGVETGEEQGVWKLLVEHDTKLILGGAFLSGQGGETMAVVEMAMIAKMPYTVLRDGIFSHPTWAESLNNLFLQLDSNEESREGKDEYCRSEGAYGP